MTLLRQGTHYVLVGLLQLLLDWAVFVAATALGMPVAGGNIVGRVAGALLGFWLNGRITFASDGARLGWRRFGRFVLVWSLMTMLSTWLVGAVAHSLGLQWAWLAKPLVEGALAAITFFLWRHVVYR
ncbi:MAG TPA: GtrA family protein [Stenotrophomonas sp.]|nr:GtrA family protein [Stenotrophomonas sp.]